MTGIKECIHQCQRSLRNGLVPWTKSRELRPNLAVAVPVGSCGKGIGDGWLNGAIIAIVGKEVVVIEFLAKNDGEEVLVGDLLDLRDDDVLSNSEELVPL